MTTHWVPIHSGHPPAGEPGALNVLRCPSGTVREPFKSTQPELGSSSRGE